ncbi:MAG: flavin reductase family protein, partial [Ignisphaera sp.]
MELVDPGFLECDMSTWNYILHPRPVVIVISGDWVEYSAMAASWVMPVSRRPPIVAIAIARSRYTYELILKYREFSLCVLDSKHAAQVHKLGTVSGRNIKDKIGYVGLTKARSSKIRAPIIKESLAVAECVLKNAVEAGDHDIVIG